MEPPKGDSLKRPDMVMCGDHPSITKTELNAREERSEDKDKKDKTPVGYARISPSTSRERAPAEKTRQVSEHALRLLEARRHVRALEVVSRHDDLNAPANRALVQAALGSFRWPPYLVAVWVLVLLLTHLLHCLVTMLERALPALKKLCAYFRSWTEEAWHDEAGGAARLSPLALAGATGALYASYCGLYALHAVALWAVEPLAAEQEDETRVTNYVEEVASKVNSSIAK